MSDDFFDFPDYDAVEPMEIDGKEIETVEELSRAIIDILCEMNYIIHNPEEFIDKPVDSKFDNTIEALSLLFMADPEVLRLILNYGNLGFLFVE